MVLYGQVWGMALYALFCFLSRGFVRRYVACDPMYPAPPVTRIVFFIADVLPLIVSDLFRFEMAN